LKGKNKIVEQALRCILGAVNYYVFDEKLKLFPSSSFTVAWLCGTPCAVGNFSDTSVRQYFYITCDPLFVLPFDT
jgi:hypothetical protein